MDGLVFDIQRFSIHDGPGIRTSVFLQGCNLRCFWCHNPESQSPTRQVQFFPDKCIACEKCIELCPQHAQLLVDGKRVYRRDLCRTCGACVDACFAQALVIKAKRMTVEQVMAEVERDMPYYADSGGGVTFSGGEPLLQGDFLLEMLRQSKQRGLHTAVDTAAHVPWPALAALLPYVDLFLVDMKVVDEQRHRLGSGAGNRRILENMRRLGGRANVWIRIPVIPGFNDDEDEMERMAGFLAGLKSVRRVELLPLHHLGAGKYDSLGLAYPARGLEPLSQASMSRLAGMFVQHELDARPVA
jgi:pyruvate formate lyase activating enzyme